MAKFIVLLVPLIYAGLIFTKRNEIVLLKWKWFAAALAIFFASWIVLSIVGVFAAEAMGFDAATEGIYAVWVFLILCIPGSLILSKKLVKANARSDAK